MSSSLEPFMLVGDVGNSNDSDPPFYGNQHSLQRKLSNSEPVCAGLCLVGVVRRRLVAPRSAPKARCIQCSVVLCGAPRPLYRPSKDKRARQSQSTAWSTVVVMGLKVTKMRTKGERMKK